MKKIKTLLEKPNGMTKRNLFYTIMVTLFVFSACSSDEEEVIIDDVPMPVSNVETTPDYGSLTFTWENPSDADFDHVEINYLNHKGLPVSVTAQNGTSEVSIDGFVDVKEYSFDLFAVDTNGNKSEATSVLATPENAAHNLLVETVVVTAKDGNVKVEWVNETSKAVKLAIEYSDNEEVVKRIDVDATETGSTTFDDLSHDNSRVYFYAFDNYDNETEVSEHSFIYIGAVSTDNWEVIDFSSQEPAEGWWKYPHDGLVEAAFDGELESFWHTDWANLSPDYPHHFTIDMGDNYTVASFECYRRQRNSKGQTKIELYGKSDGEEWTEFGEYDYDAYSDDLQEFDIPDTDMQFFKFVATEGNDYYAFLAEINVIIKRNLYINPW